MNHMGIWTRARQGAGATLAAIAVASLFLAACGAREPAPDAALTDPLPLEEPQPAALTEGAALTAEPLAPAEADAPAAGPGDGRMPAAGVIRFAVVPADSQVTYLASEEFFTGAVERLGKALGFTQPLAVAGGVNGELDVSLEPRPEVVGGRLEVDLRGFTSDDNRRDNRIREEYLESNVYPIASYSVLGAEGLPAVFEEGRETTFTLLGDLTVRETTVPVAWQVTAMVTGATLTGSASTTVRMSDFGVSPPNVANLFKVEDEVALTARLVAVADW
jgi:polyisoprenoid-binding protein YceI